MNKKQTITVNGYTIRFNPFWQLWQISHSESGYFGEFEKLQDAIEEANRG